MWQRIQTVFLGITFVLYFVIFLFPFVNLVVGDISYSFMYRGFIDSATGEAHVATLPVMILQVIIMLLSLFTIFLFKRRPLQMRLCVFTIILLLGHAGMIAFYMFTTAKDQAAVIQYNWPVVVPIIAIVLIFLARTQISKDENRVRAADRIR